MLHQVTDSSKTLTSRGKLVMVLPHRAVEHPLSLDRRLRSPSPRPRTLAQYPSSLTRRPRSSTHSSSTRHETLELQRRSPYHWNNELPIKDRRNLGHLHPDGLADVGPSEAGATPCHDSNPLPPGIGCQAGGGPRPCLAGCQPESVGRLRP